MRSRARANQIQCWPAPCGHMQAAPCPPWLCARPPGPIRAFLHGCAGMHAQAKPRAGAQCTRSRGPKNPRPPAAHAGRIRHPRAPRAACTPAHPPGDPACRVVRCFIEATLEHSQAPGAYVQACALLPPPSPLFQRKYRAHRHCPRSIPGANPAGGLWMTSPGKGIDPGQRIDPCFQVQRD